MKRLMPQIKTILCVVLLSSMLVGMLSLMTISLVSCSHTKAAAQAVDLMKGITPSDCNSLSDIRFASRDDRFIITDIYTQDFQYS